MFQELLKIENNYCGAYAHSYAQLLHFCAVHEISSTCCHSSCSQPFNYFHWHNEFIHV